MINLGGNQQGRRSPSLIGRRRCMSHGAKTPFEPTCPALPHFRSRYIQARRAMLPFDLSEAMILRLSPVTCCPTFQSQCSDRPGSLPSNIVVEPISYLTGTGSLVHGSQGRTTLRRYCVVVCFSNGQVWRSSSHTGVSLD